MASIGWKGQVTNTQKSVRKIEIAESSPFVVQSGIEQETYESDDERLFLEASPVIQEEDDESLNQINVLYQVQAVGDFKAQEDSDLTFKAGEILQILDSSHEDGWLLAENALGERGTVPGNYVQRLQDISETKDDMSTPMAREGKHLWGKLKSNVKQTNLSDVLNAFGALPSGFRESTLNHLLNESKNYQTSLFMFPRLTMTGMAFKDLKWDHTKDQLLPKTTSVCRHFVVLAAKMIPSPGKSVKVLSRHVRIALFNKTEILSNIHTVRANWNPQEEKTWSFLSKNLTANNSLYHRTGLLRVDTLDRNIELLFELCITFKKAKSGQVQEFSSGWSILPLFDHAGAQLANRTYELKVHGGTPFESGIELDPAQGIQAAGGRMPSLLRKNRMPRLYVQLINQGREAKVNSKLIDYTLMQCCLLPSTIVTSQHYIKAIGCFRQLVGEAFLSNRKGLPIPSLVYKPSLGLFIKAIDQPDVMDYTLDLWQQHLQALKKNEKNSLTSISSSMEKILLQHTYPVLYSITLPPIIWGNPEREKERGIVLEKFSKYRTNTALLSSDLQPLPLNVGEQIFKVYA